MSYRRNYSTFTPSLFSSYANRLSGYSIPSYSVSQQHTNGYPSSCTSSMSSIGNFFSPYNGNYSNRSSSLIRNSASNTESSREKSLVRTYTTGDRRRESSPKSSSSRHGRSSRRDYRDVRTVDQSHRSQSRSNRSKSSTSSGYNSRSNSVSEKEEKESGKSRKGSAENGDIDYKKLYEEQLTENDRLMNRLRSYEKELRQARETLSTNNKVASTRNAAAESERREKRALERKLSEMEEELRLMQKLKSENEKLRAENRALTRVVSKLTNSASLANFGK